MISWIATVVIDTERSSGRPEERWRQNSLECMRRYQNDKSVLVIETSKMCFVIFSWNCEVDRLSSSTFVEYSKHDFSH